jgi:phosphonate transport system permease protein
MSGLATDSRRTAPAGPADGAGGTARRRFSRSSRAILWLLAAAFFVFACLQLGIVPSRLLEATDRATFVLGVIFPPVVNDPINLMNAAVESVQIAIVGTAFGIALSLVLAVLAARNVSPLGPFSWIVKGVAAFERSVPSLVWALLFIVAVGLGPTPGILALAVGCVGMLVKVYAEAIEEIPMGPIEALRAAGASRLQVFVQGILPGVVGVFIAWSVFRFDINIRYSSILGVVGAGGIGWELVRAAHGGHYDIAMGVTLVIFGMVVGTEVLSERLRQRAESESVNARRKVLSS